MAVMSYAKKGNLRKCLPDIIKFKWQRKLQLLKKIVLGLKVIHESNLAHGDFHDGNILISDNYSELFIIDLGLCKPMSDLQDSDNVHGVLSYIAPEIFKKNPYTPASDIYSFSMIMWEFTSGNPPFSEECDIKSICGEGKRPEIIKNTPKCYKDLMKKCWDDNPSNRPTVIMLENIISQWIDCINEYYRMNKDENYIIIPPIDNQQLRNDMLEFVEANTGTASGTEANLEQDQGNTSITQSHLQEYYTSRKLTTGILIQENSEDEDLRI
jgi:serine/threonine protein kinase